MLRNPASCRNPGIDAAKRAGIARRHRGDDGPLEPVERVRLGKPVDRGRVDAGVDRAAHQDHRGGLARVVPGGQQRHRRQHRNRWLAYRHHMDARPEQPDKADHQLDEIVEIEPAVEQRNVARVDPVGQIDVVIGEQGFDGAAQQGREMPGKRRHDQHGRLVAGRILAEMQQVAERVRGDDLLADRDLLAVDRYRSDAEIRPLMRHAGVGQQLHRRSGAAHARHVADRQPWMAEPVAGGLGHQPDRPENVVLCLVGVVKHIPS